MYMNDLPAACLNCNVQMYADDAVIFNHGKYKKIIATNLTNSQTKVQNWLNQICLTLNTKKTVVFTVWSFARVTALKPINQLYKKSR